MITIFGFGNHAKSLFEQYNVCGDEIKAIVDNKPRDIVVYSHNPWLKPVAKSMITAVSWETYFKNETKYKADKAVIGSNLYENEIISELLIRGSYSRDNIISIREWISGFPLILGGGVERKFKNFIVCPENWAYRKLFS